MDGGRTGRTPLENGQRRKPRKPFHKRRGGDPDPQMGRHGHPSGGGSRAPQSRSENSGMHQPARPHRSPRFQRPADRELRADFLQAGRASPQGGRNASAANRQLHTAHRPRIHRPAGKSQAHHAGGAQQGMVRIFKSESRSLRFHALPCDQPEQRMADRDGRGTRV